MIDHIIRFIAKVDDKESQWLLQNGTSYEAAEKMCLQFIQILAQLKAQEPAKEVVKEPEIEQPKE